MDKKTKVKQEKLIEMVSSFCEKKLNEEYKNLCVNLIEKMGRKHNVPFKRGKLEIWASGVIYAIAQINFLFDKSQELYTTPDEICDFFNTKKSTASDKARDIRKMFKMGVFDNEFSANAILDSRPNFFIDEYTGLLVHEDLIPSTSTDYFFDEIYSEFAMGNTDEAIKMLDSIPEGSPEYDRALFYKSFMISEEDENEGFELFKEALTRAFDFNGDSDLYSLADVESDDPYEIFEKGKDIYYLGDYDVALSYFDLALDLKPDYDMALYYKSLALSFLGDFENAVMYIDKAISLNHLNDEFWNDKGNYLVKLGKIDEAHVCFDKAIELKPEDYIVWSNKAFAYLEEREFEKALGCYDKSMRLSCGNILPIVGKANVYAAMKDLSNAEIYYNIAREIDEYDLEFLVNYANFLLFQKKYETAIEYLDKYLEINDKNPMIWILKAFAYAGIKDDDRLDECLEKACEIDPLFILTIDELYDEIMGE